MVTQEYRTNRARIAQAELSAHRGAWVAFSADGRQIVASGQSVEELEELLAAAGKNGQNAVLEWLPGPEDDCMLGAGGNWM